MDALDKKFKSLLENHEVPVDTEELWRSVAPRLGKPRSYRNLFFLLFLLIGFPLGYLLFTLPGEPQQTLQSSPEATSNSFFGRKGQLVNIQPEADTPQNQSLVPPSFRSGEWKKAQADGHKPKGNAASGKNFRDFGREGLSVHPAFQEIQKATKENDVKAESDISSLHDSEGFTDVEPRIMPTTKKVATNTGIQPVISLFDQKVGLNSPVFALKEPFRWSVDLFGGPDYTRKLMESKAYDYRWYSRERYNTEKYLTSFNIGLQFNLEHSSGLFAGSGLVYHGIEEMFESTGKKDVMTFREGVVEIITHADGSSTEVTGQKLVIEQKSWSKRKYNRYGFLNVPVFFGWSHQAGPVRLAYSAGLDINMYFHQSGEILGQEGFPVSLSQAQNSIFRKRTAVNLNGGIKLLYPVSERLVFYLEPHVHYNLFSITTPEYPLEQRYLHTGLRLGTRINL
jgi:hypothetical protein